MIAVRPFTNDALGGFWSWLPLDGAMVEAAASIFITLPE